MRERERENMNKKFVVGLGFSLVVSTMTNIAPANADYPAVAGLTQQAGTSSCPVFIDPTPASIPANAKIVSLSVSAKSVTMTSGKATVLKLQMPHKSSYAAVTIKCVNTTKFYPILINSKGLLQLPAFALIKAGVYTMTIKDVKGTRTLKITVK